MPELPAGDDSVSAPMTSQITEDGSEAMNRLNQNEASGMPMPEVHSDTESPLSEQQEALKEDHEYRRLTEQQEHMYEQIQKIKPADDTATAGDSMDSHMDMGRNMHDEYHHNEKRTKKDENKRGVVSNTTSLNNSSGHTPIVNDQAPSGSAAKQATNNRNAAKTSDSKTAKKKSGVKLIEKIKKLRKKSKVERRSTENNKADKTSVLKPEKEKEQKAGRKNVVIVNRPPILYHPPPEIYHRPPIVLHRPPILVQRPAIVYHQPPVIVHRPAVLYRQPPLVFHQPPPVISQPMLHSHDTFTTRPALQHVESKVMPAGTVLGIPPASRWNPNAKMVVDSDHDTGSVLQDDDDDHQALGGTVLLGQGHTRQLSLDSEEDTIGEQKSGIPTTKHAKKAHKKGSLPHHSTKSHPIVRREAPKANANETAPKVEKEASSAPSQNNTKRSETSTAVKQGKKGTKKDVVVNRPPIIYHPPPEIYHRPDIVIHRPPIVIHRPPIIYHQPPVIVHRPAVVYHQPPIVFHQPPPAVQQPLLYSHDTFVVHPSFVAQHLGSILRTAHHYVGPPRLLTHLGHPLFDGEQVNEEHSYPQETHSFDLSHMGGEESDAIGGHNGMGLLGHMGGLGDDAHFGGLGGYDESHFGGEGHLGGEGHFGGEGHYGGEGHFGGEGQFGGQGHFGGEGQYGGQGHFGGEGQYGGQGHFGGFGRIGGDSHFGGEGNLGFLGNGVSRGALGGNDATGEGFESEQHGGFLGGLGNFGRFGGGLAKRSHVEHAKKRSRQEGTVKYQDIAGSADLEHQDPVNVYHSTMTSGHVLGMSGHGADAAHSIYDAMLSHEMHDQPAAMPMHTPFESHDAHYTGAYHTDAPIPVIDAAMHVEGAPTHIVETTQQIVHQPVVLQHDPPTVLHPVYHEIDSTSGHSSSEGYVPDEGSATHYVHFHPLTIHHHHIHHFHILKPDDEYTVDDEPIHVHHSHHEKDKKHKHKVTHLHLVTDHDPTVKKKSEVRRSPEGAEGTLTAF